jgi:enoyl-CoA hydratase/carnithine racemase
MTASPQDRGLVTEISDSIAMLRFDRPASRNSLSENILAQLENTLAAILTRADINAVVFTGTGDCFASGADIVELTKLTPETALIFSKRGQALCQMIAGARQTTIAAINGYCMGGALDLVLACDIRVASREAVFAHPGARLGIITGWGGTQRLPRLIGRARALEFFTTARRVDSEEALAIGLISEVFDPVLDRALELARV